MQLQVYILFYLVCSAQINKNDPQKTLLKTKILNLNSTNRGFYSLLLEWALCVVEGFTTNIDEAMKTNQENFISSCIFPSIVF